LDNYRIKYKKGDFELEIESTEKSYVDEKLQEMLKSTLAPKPKVDRKKQSKKKGTTSSSQGEGIQDGRPQVDIPAIIEAINDDDEHDKIEEQILNKSAILPRVLMCLQFSQETVNEPLTTGDIQTITDQLGIKVSSANAGTAIKKNLKYFTTDSVRKKGAIMKYKLNRKGLQAYQKALDGEKI
jgi:hypothetical protein